MSILPFREKPDLGPVRAVPNPVDPEALLVNVAGVVAIAAQQDTPQARRLYGAFLAAWPNWKYRPLSENERQGGALAEALASLGSNVTLTPMPDAPR